MRRSAAGLLIALVVLAGCSETSTDGRVLYSRRCATCHGADLEGAVGPALDASSPSATASDESIRTVIRQGAKGMPSDRSLNDVQLGAIVDYVRRLQAP